MSDPQRAAATVERWSLPRVDGPLVGREREARKNAEATRALQESEARGYEAGLARARAETQDALDALGARIKQLDSILQLLSKPLQELDAAIEKELLQLALTVGKQLARRELRIDPAQVIAILRESLAQLPASAREIRVHLHPQDAATIRERLAAPANERAWTLVEDPTLTRGGCLVRTETSQIDVRLESRISAVVASALGEERAPERPTPQPGETEA